MASINNLAATGDIFVKVGEGLVNNQADATTSGSDATGQTITSVGSVFIPYPAVKQHLKNYAIVFGGTDPKIKGKIKLIDSIVSATEVNVKPDFEVPTGTPFTIHKSDFLADETGIVVSGSISGVQPGENSDDLATRAYVDDVVVGGRFSIWNYMKIFQVSDESATGEYTFTDSEGNGIIVDIRNAMVTRNGSILEPIKDYSFDEASVGTTKLVMNPATTQSANVVVRATLGASENLNAGIEHVEVISNDSTSEVVLPFVIYDKAATLVTVDGVVQSSENYEIARTPVEDGYELKVIRFKAGETLSSNSVFRAVNLKGAAFLGNFNVSILIDDNTPTPDGDGNPSTVAAQGNYTVTKDKLISRNGLNLYANTSSPVDIYLPEMSYGHSSDDSIRIKIKRGMGANTVTIHADAANHFNYEGLDMSSGSINTAQGGYVENLEVNPDYVTKLDFEWESAFNTWVINNGIGTWNVSRGS